MLGKVVVIPMIISSVQLSPVPTLTIAGTKSSTPTFIANDKGIVYHLTDDAQLRFQVNISALKFFLGLTVEF